MWQNCNIWPLRPENNVIFGSWRSIIMNILSVPYHFYWSFELWMVTTSASSYSWWSTIATCVFPIMEGKEKKDGKCVWLTISVFLGTSRLISLHGVEGLTWTLDSFPLFSIFVSSFCSPSLSQSPWIHLCRLNLHQSASFSLSPHLFTLSAAKLASVNRGLVCVCARVFSCVWHASYWTLSVNLWPPCSLWVKRSNIK